MGIRRNLDQEEELRFCRSKLRYDDRGDMRSATLLIGLLLSTTLARADTDTDEQAKRAFEEGRDAYESGDYETACKRFKSSYLLSGRPAMLFNLANCYDRWGRPHEAAESLRAYLRVVPYDRERPDIELRIRALEEKQRMIGGVETTATASPPRRPLYKRWWLWTAVGGGVVLTVALGVGLGVGLR
jgi:hypothetical protein